MDVGRHFFGRNISELEIAAQLIRAGASGPHSAFRANLLQLLRLHHFEALFLDKTRAMLECVAQVERVFRACVGGVRNGYNRTVH
jgi:hypothetical protein